MEAFRRTTLVEDLITAGVMAGGYTKMGRRHPGARSVQELRAKWSDKAATLADRICADAAINDPAFVARDA